MKKSDLYREWARVLDMCEGKKVRPEDCWKWDGAIQHFYPCLTNRRPLYDFAVAILEDKPVFVGDKLYLKDTQVSGIVTEHWTNINANLYSWTTKTFMLNGVELPCPDSSNEHELIIMGFEEHAYHFIKSCDIKKVEDAINKLLQDATK